MDRPSVSWNICALRTLTEAAAISRLFAAFLALLAASLPVAAKAADCGGWNEATFFRAATNGDVRACLAAGADPNARDKNDRTPWDAAQTNWGLRGTDAWDRLRDGRD